MSIATIQRQSGKAYRVKYYVAGRQRYETTPVYNDARSMDAAIHQARSSMDPEAFNRLMEDWRSSPRVGGAGAFREYMEHWRRTGSQSPTETLADFYKEWMHTCCEGRLRPTTISSYACMWNTHIKDELGHHPLSKLADEPRLVDAWAAKLHRDGVGLGSQRRAIVVLGAMFRVAVRWRKVRHNPCDGLRKPSAKRTRSITLVPPSQVEALCATLSPRDAMLVRLLAYCGLRPGEALALRGSDIGTHTLLVDRAVNDKHMDDAKNARGHRSVRIYPVVRELLGDLPRGPLFVDEQGQHWSKDDWTTWMRILRRKAAALGITLGRGYDLRHTFVSMLIRSGMNVVEVAAQAGHSPQMCLSTYAHVFAELESEPKRDVDSMIREAAKVSAFESLSSH